MKKRQIIAIVVAVLIIIVGCVSCSGSKIDTVSSKKIDLKELKENQIAVFTTEEKYRSIKFSETYEAACSNPVKDPEISYFIVNSSVTKIEQITEATNSTWKELKFEKINDKLTKFYFEDSGTGWFSSYKYSEKDARYIYKVTTDAQEYYFALVG